MKEKDRMFKSTGVFFDDEVIAEFKKQVGRLPYSREGVESEMIFVPINLSPGPNDIHEEWFGTDVNVEVVGYGKIPGLEAFTVRFYPTFNNELNKILKGIHEVGKAVMIISCTYEGIGRINDLPFWAISEPFFLAGKYGAVMRKNGAVTTGVSE